MALEPNEKNTEHEYHGKGWDVFACVQRIFVPTKQRTNKGKPVSAPVSHRWIDLLHEDGDAIRFYLSRTGRFSDSRQQSKDNALTDAFKGHDRTEMLNELERLTGNRQEAARAIWAL